MSDNYQATPIGYEVKGTVKAEGRTLRRVPVLIEGDSKKQVLTNDEGVLFLKVLHRTENTSSMSSAKYINSNLHAE